MIKIKLGLAGGYSVNVYTGKRGLDEFKKSIKKYIKENPTLDFVQHINSYDGNGECAFSHCGDIYVSDKNDMMQITHEMVHAITWVRNTCGFEDSPLQEWLAYTLQYCLEEYKNKINKEG